MGDRLAGASSSSPGASGIAAAGARRFAAEGARVGIVSRDAAKGDALAADIDGGRRLASLGRRRTSATEARRSRPSRPSGAFGRIDGLFARRRRIRPAGRRRAAPRDPAVGLARDARPERDAGLPGRAGGAALDARGPGARGRRGSIVLVSSVLATHPAPRLFATHAYAAVKGAEVALVRTMAAYYAPHGIRVNAIQPGLVATPMSARAAADPETSAYAAAQQPLAGGFIDAEAVADAGLFLLSDEAGQVTGQWLAVDGGWGVTEARCAAAE